MKSEPIQLHAVFRGKVQGVGFRWTVAEQAEHFQLKGTVQNLKNGSVEVYAQGSKKDLEAFLESLKADPGIASIDSVTCTFQSIETVLTHFKILR